MPEPVAAVVDAYSAGRFLPEAFHRAGARVVHVQGTPEFLASVPPPDLRPYTGNVVHLGDLDRTAALLAGYVPRCVVPGQESAVELADRLAERMGLPGNGSALSAARRDKYAMVDTLRRAGLRCARQRKARSAADAGAWAAREGYPVVVKPLRSASADGVAICRTAEDVRLAADAVLGSVDIFGDPNAEVLVQSYLDGSEYFVDTVSWAGERYVCGVWRYAKATLGRRRVYDRDILLDPDTAEARLLIDYVDTVLSALGIRYGAAHSEVILTADGPALVEIGARVNGLIDPAFHDLCLGANQSDLLATASVRPDDFSRGYAGAVYRKRAEAVVYHAQTSQDGVLTAIDDDVLARIAALETVRAVTPRVAVGGRIRPTVDLLTSPLRVFMAGDSAERIDADYRAAVRLARRLFHVADPTDPGDRR